MPEMTYRRLDDVLRSIGFTIRVVDDARVYEHSPTGALFVFPQYPLDDPVLPHHLAGVRGSLYWYGFGDPFEQDAKPLPAS